MELVNSIVRAATILELLKDKGKMTYMAIWNKMNIPKSTLSKILTTLEHEELITKDRETNHYQLGVKLIEWGKSARSHLELRKLAAPYMEYLKQKLDTTIHLTVMVENMVLPIEALESANWYNHHFKYSGAVGLPAPLHCTGGGKAILAFMDRKGVEEIIDSKGLEKFTEHTILRKETLLRELEEVRKNGYAVSNGEHDALIRSVAAPIRNHEGRVIGALSVLGVTTKITFKRIPEIAKDVLVATTEISKKMGYKG